MKIALVSCVAKKANIEEGVLCPDKIYILSAKHGLLEPDDFICKYNESLYGKKAKDRVKWGENVLNSLRNKGVAEASYQH